MTQRRWTHAHDVFLIFHGACVGYDFVATHDLGRTPDAARKRMVWLRKNKPELVKELGVVVDMEPDL